MSSPIHGGMRNPHEGVILGPDPPRPSCDVCSREEEARTRLRGCRVLVSSCLVVRDTSSGVYRAIVKCHGATDVIELGADPSEFTVNGARAFKDGR